MIVLVYKIINVFGDYNVYFAADIMPVIFFALTIISFFLFVREIFIRKDEDLTKANIIAIISTIFMIIIPAFLSRTLAGIPEKESVGFFFMFLSFYLFLKAWKSEGLKTATIRGMLAGISTALMGLTWGGVSYIYVSVGVAGFIGFILNKFHKKEKMIYASWIIVAIITTLTFTNRFSLKGFLTGTDTSLAFFVLSILVIDTILWKTRIHLKLGLEKLKIPKNITSIIISCLLLILLGLIFLGPSYFTEKLQMVNQMMFKPITGRWGMTVAENRQPYFTEWGASFGPFIKNIPILFWLFFAGSVVLFRKMLNKIESKDAWILTGCYVLFFFGLVFSRYAPHPSLFDGEDFISKGVYYGAAILLIGMIIYYFIKYHREQLTGFEKIEFEYLLLLSVFVLCLFTARSAVRLIMVLAPIAPIFVAYLIMESLENFKKVKDETWKIVFGIILIILIALSLFIFVQYYKEIKAEAYAMVPSYYNQQWQMAMNWVRNGTPSDAVFAHWWDYGYWVQSIGNRATVTDGGNNIVWWNYLSGRLVLTGDNQKDSLNFLYSHNATHLLIDSSDIGKYGAFSSIGSDQNYDRYSWIPVMVSDDKQIVETSTGIKRIYQGGYGLDEDLIYYRNETKIFLPAQMAGIGGIIIEITKQNGSSAFKQPEAIFVYQNQQYSIPIRYVYFNNQFIDFNGGINGTVYIIPRVVPSAGSVQIDSMGAAIFISPRVMRGYLAQKYLLNDPFKKFNNFNLVHTEPNVIVNSFKNQGQDLGDFVYYQGLQGPIKIWEINYTGKEEIKQEFLDTDARKYISWEL